MFGEEGESMYGGVNKNRNQMEFDKKNIGKYYLEMKYINFSKKQKNIPAICEFGCGEPFNPFPISKTKRTEKPH